MKDAVEGKEHQFCIECNNSSKHEIPSDREEVCLDFAAMFCDSTDMYMNWIIAGLINSLNRGYHKISIPSHRQLPYLNPHSNLHI